MRWVREMSEGDAAGTAWAGLGCDGEGRRGLGWSVAATVMSEGVIWELRVREKEIESDGENVRYKIKE